MVIKLEEVDVTLESRREPLGICGLSPSRDINLRVNGLQRPACPGAGLVSVSASVPVGEDVQSVVSDHLPQGWRLFVSEPLLLPFRRDFQCSRQSGAGAERQLQGCTYVLGTCGCCDSSAESGGNSGEERGRTPQCALPASSLVCEQFGLRSRNVPVLE